MGEMDLDLTGRLMADMDPQLLDFLRTKVNSFVKWDLVRFFHDNPHTADTVENIARYAGRSVSAIESGLVELAEDGVLNATQVGGMTIYSLASDHEVQQMLGEFVKASDERQFRVKAIYHIIRGMR